METRFLYALISAALSWFVSFLNKVSAYHKQDGAFVSFYSSIWGLISWILLALLYAKKLPIDHIILLSGLFSGIAVYFWLIFRIKSLSYIDTTIFFPLYKTFWPLVVLGISFFLFSEILNTWEALWIVVGLIVPLFILNKKSHQADWFKNGIFFLILCVLISAFPAYIWKFIYNNHLSIFTYLILVNGVWAFIWIMTRWKELLQVQKKNHFWIIVWLLGGILYFFAWYFFVQAMEWNLAIVFSINSFSFLIPIILSIYFYKEHFDLKKWLAILFTIFSIYLMK